MRYIKSLPTVCLVVFCLCLYPLQGVSAGVRSKNNTVIDATKVSTEQGGIVRSISISGNARIEDSTVLSHMNLHIGDSMSEFKETEITRDLYDSGLFEEVKVSFHNGVLSINIVEMPLVKKVEFLGTKKIKPKDLQSEISSTVGATLSNVKVKSDIEKIKELYIKEGRYSVKVTSRVEKLPNHKAKLIFDIVEGPKTAIAKVVFVGNNNYTDQELKSVIMSKEKAFWRFMTSDDTYDPNKVEVDKMFLRNFYHSLGYANFEVLSVSVELSPTKDSFVMIFNIEEGEKYKYSNISLDNRIKDISEKDLRVLMKMKPGQTYNGDEIRNVTEKMTNYLADRGYSDVEVLHYEKKDDAGLSVDLSFVVEKSQKIYVNRINIFGNVKTRDKVIRRQLRLNEGDVFNKTALHDFDKDIRGIDYFEDVDWSVDDVDGVDLPDRKDVNITVQEKSTSEISFNAAYSTLEEMIFGIGFTERNLLGTGTILHTGVSRSRKSLSYSLGLTDPAFLDRDLSAGISFFNVEGQTDSRSQQYKNYTRGLNLSMGYDIAHTVSHSVVYSFKDSKNTLKPNIVLPYYLNGQIGDRVSSEIHNTLTYADLDSKIAPKNGFVLSYTNVYAGLGADTHYVKNEVSAYHMKSFYHNKLTLKSSVSLGSISGLDGQIVRMSDRFNLGDQSFRGFDVAGIGPRDKATEESLGGKKYYTINFELTFPIGAPKDLNVSGAIFCDLGSLWGYDMGGAYNASDVYDSKKMRSSAGVGIIWTTKMAPISIYYGRVFSSAPGDQKKHLTLKMATSF